MSPEDYLPISVPDVSGNEGAYLQDCIESGWVSSIGSYVEKFEQEFAAFSDQPYGVSVNSGTAALQLALRALDIGPGDEVIVPALTFAACANAVLYQSATPVLADSSESSWNIDPATLASLVTPRTRAIMPVHLYGAPCEMEAILALAENRGIPIVEDAAEAHGARWGERPVGGMGTIGCFSFYGNKIITTGEGGMCVTGDEALYQRMCTLRDHGMNRERRYWHDTVGFNFRMTNLQAAVGCAQLERIESFLEKKRWIASSYNALLDGLDCTLPTEQPGTRNVFWLYTLLLPRDCTECERDQLIRWLAECRIDSRPMFYPLHRMPPYRRYARDTPNADSFCARGITLPSFQGLTAADIERVTSAIRSWLSTRRE